MCGIAGVFENNVHNHKIVSNMINLLTHRGNDSMGEYDDEKVILCHTRLAILGLEDGQQPVANHKKNIISITNGEIYNYQELSAILKGKGYEFSDHCDTNIIPYLYEEFGLKMFEIINGQFAMAIWDKESSKLILARDKFGEKPLYYRKTNKSVFFASEIMPLLLAEESSEVNTECLKDICTTWVPVGNKTVYKDIYSVGSGAYIEIDNKDIVSNSYYKPIFFNSCYENKTKKQLIYELDLIMQKSIIRHINADVPIAFYLSGGLDSSLIAAIASANSRERIHTFSLSFCENSIDETRYQDVISEKFNTMHHRLKVSEDDIVDSFYDVVLHLQTPILRLGSVPMFLLAKYVHSKGFKVVLSGEGADELFGGYDIFKEVKIRSFCQKETQSNDRALLYKKTNSYISDFHNVNSAALAAFFNQVSSDDFFSSHAIRFRFGKYCSQFFSADVKASLKEYSVIDNIKADLPRFFSNYSDIAQAQYLEIKTFMENYLLSSQGDRAAMAYGVECRYPFLDFDVIDYALKLNDRYKINVLNEKYILKELAKKYLPNEITNRIKFPYRAMISHKRLLKDDRVMNAISENKIEKCNIFDAHAVRKFIDKINEKENITEKELMLLLFICSTQIILGVRNSN
jgi:asparagine synthase (glutamine-hydrolysing)